MDLPSRRRRRKVPFQEQYPTRFQLYTYPPTQDISLSEFEKLATDRQQCETPSVTHRERERERGGEE